MLTKKLSSVAALAMLSAFSLSAAAAVELEVRCEKRATRARVSVDGENLVTGMYQAAVVSNGIEFRSPLQSTQGDEVEFDFDSDPRDIAAGATAIPSDFIVDGRVKAYLYDAANALVASTDAICRVRR